MFGYEVTCCPEPGQLAAYLREVRPERDLRRAARLGEAVRRRQRRARGRPREGAQFNEGVEPAAPIAEAAAWGTRHRRAARRPGVPRRRRVRAPARAARARPAASRHHRRRADPAPSCCVVPRASACRSRRSTACRENCGPMTWRRSHQARHGRPGDPGLRGEPRPTTARSSAAAATCSAGYLERPGEDRRGARRRRLAAHRRHRRVRRRRLLPHRRPQEGADHHRRRQEHQPGQPGGGAQEIPLVGQACAIGDDRPFVAALLVLDPDVAAGVGAPQHGIDYATLDELADDPEVLDEVEAGSTRSWPSFNSAERVKKVQGARRGLAPRLRGAHADVEAQAARHPRPLRREIEAMYG